MGFEMFDMSWGSGAVILLGLVILLVDYFAEVWWRRFVMLLLCLGALIHGLLWLTVPVWRYDVEESLVNESPLAPKVLVLERDLMVGDGSFSGALVGEDVDWVGPVRLSYGGFVRFDAVSKGGGEYLASLDKIDSLALSWMISSGEVDFQMLKSDQRVQFGRWSYHYSDSPYARTACYFVLIGVFLEFFRWLFRVYGAGFLRKRKSKLASDRH